VLVASVAVQVELGCGAGMVGYQWLEEVATIAEVPGIAMQRC